jgi:heptosyltransferase II
VLKKDKVKILVINPFGIGDVLFSTPLLRNLKKYNPTCKLYYLCNKRVAPLLRNNPLIEKIFIYERDDFEQIKQQSRFLWFKSMFSFLMSIRKEHIDISFDLSLNTKFGFFSFFAGIPQRIGFDYKKRGFFLTRKLVIDGFNDKHVAEYYLDILRLVGIPVSEEPFELFLANDDKTEAEGILRQHGFEKKRIIGIAPCGGESFGKHAGIKRWPLENFATVINRLIRQYDVGIILLAGPKEKEEINAIIRLVNKSENIIDATECSIVQIAALVEKSDIVLSNDTGPLRFANAFGNKIVAIFGPVDDTVYGLYPPHNKNHVVIKKDLLCRPCYCRFRLRECTSASACLTTITVDEVFNAVAGLVADIKGE